MINYIKGLGLFVCFLFLSSLTVSAQDMFMVSNGDISFTSDAPLELIEAESDNVQGVIQALDRSFAFRVLMKSFDGFNSATQKAHFNSNYLETETYKYTSFEGKIIEEVDLTTPGTYQVRAKGKFMCHGLKEERIIRCKMVVKSDGISISADFTVLLDDHNIKIPSVVNQKIAEEIQVSIKLTLAAK